jgi:oligogalacturonide lyase
MKTSPLVRVALLVTVLFAGASAVASNVGKRYPSEMRVFIDKTTGVPVTALTTGPSNDAKIYQDHPQWTADGRYIIFRSNRGAPAGVGGAPVGAQAFAINETTGEIIQLTDGPETGTGSLNVARKSMKLYFFRGGGPGSKSPAKLIELNLETLFADSEAGTMKADSAYEREIMTLPSNLIEAGGFALDADEKVAYIGVTRLDAIPGGKAPEIVGLAEGAMRGIQATLAPKADAARRARWPSRQAPARPADSAAPGRRPQHRPHDRRDQKGRRYRIHHGSRAGQPVGVRRNHLLQRDRRRRPATHVDHDGRRLAQPPALRRESRRLDHPRSRHHQGRGCVQHDRPPARLRLHASGIAVINLRNDQMRVYAQVDDQPPGGRGTGGFWHSNGSADGRWLVGDTFAGNVWLIDRRNGAMTLLTTDHKMRPDHTHPTFSPDGKRILIQSGLLSERQKPESDDRRDSGVPAKPALSGSQSISGSPCSAPRAFLRHHEGSPIYGRQRACSRGLSEREQAR